MFRNTGIKRVGRQIVFAAQQGELAQWNYQVQKAGFRADRTVAVVNVEMLWCFYGEGHLLAVTTSGITHGVLSVCCVITRRS
jgi:hypothetical protein